MSHRIEQKQAAREARVRAEEQMRHAQGRQRLLRRSGYLAVAVIAIALVGFAALSGGNGTADPMANGSGASGAAAVGAPAPPFKLTDVVSGNQVTNGSLRGHKTMLFFSEGVGCQSCMVQIGDLQKAGTLTKDGIRLVSITTDQPADLQAAAQQYGITTPLLSDPSTQMSAAYGMLGHGGMQHPTQDGHAFMLLSAKGKVLWHQAYQEMYVAPSQLMSDMQKAARA